MICSYCGSRNSETEHRCRRCGRRPGDTLTEELARHRTKGALATKARPAAAHAAQAPPAMLAPDANLARPVQGSLFPDRPSTNVIPIASFAAPQREAHWPAPAAKTDPHLKTAAATAPARPPVRRAPRVVEGQGQLDFLQPAPSKPRTLGTTVEAVIYCEAPVATPLHRAVAAALDWSMVLIAYGLFLLPYRLCGGAFEWNRTNLLVFGGALLLVAFTYGIYWAIAGTETAGMRWTQLRLLTFDGFAPEGRQHVVRFAGACLSRCTVLGLLWSLADEESLTWQDHISRTFPTPYELESRVFRRR